jgi:hypothetical protein
LVNWRIGELVIEFTNSPTRQLTNSHRQFWWAVQDSNLWQPACKAGALPLS